MVDTGEWAAGYAEELREQRTIVRIEKTKLHSHPMESILDTVDSAQCGERRGDQGATRQNMCVR